MWIYQRQIVSLFLPQQNKKAFLGKREVADALDLQLIYSFFMLFHNAKLESASQWFAAKQEGCTMRYSLRSQPRQRNREHAFSIQSTDSNWKGLRARGRTELEVKRIWEIGCNGLNFFIYSCHLIILLYQLHKCNMENGRMWRSDRVTNVCPHHAAATNKQ